MTRVYFTPVEPSPEPAAVAVALAPRGGLSWLDGGLEHGEEGRWSFVAVEPVATRTAGFGEPAPLALFGELEEASPPAERPPRGPLSPEQIPRWIGHVAYDAYWSGRAGQRHARAGTPVVRLCRYDRLYAYDHALAQGWTFADTQGAAEALARDVSALPITSAQPGFAVGTLDVTDARAHAEAIARAVEHMRAGDIYQVNLARRWRGAFEGSALGLYLRMRAHSPVPLGAFLDGGDHSVLACSMERFLRLTRSDGALWSSPIKGTLARGGSDSAERQALLDDPKERAEHSMVVDLMRNDLGRVARYGSVRVEPLMETQSFAGLHHLVSSVRAHAPDDLTLVALMEATFPPGSVTGTPKTRAMEIIEALEPCARGVYCGAVGFVDRAGGCSWAVAIRTATVTEGHVSYHAGGGLVVESDPARETAETDLKARLFLEALRA